jgi:eukaryotic-like serine/threonine-protein kinase
MPRDDSLFGTDLNGLRRLLTLGSESPGEDGSDTPAERDDPLSNYIGRHIGRFELLRVLGEGGMGIVYLAEQSEPIRRQVALKLIKPGMDSQQVINRFEAERQVLAQLTHANIAQVLDGGTTTAGRPYFVMEYIGGQPITTYCDHQKLTIQSRLTLFRQICQAVHHAHQRGIIHRDIKPSNILVAEQDGHPIPKIIDFGVAKAVAQPLTGQSSSSDDGQLFGTPAYMSPEQADLSHEDVDTRSDVYALGILLYELLVGALPYESDSLRKDGISQTRNVIHATDPLTPSTRLKALRDGAAIAAGNRSTQPKQLEKCLRRELEWIPLKAMRKERTERYQSVADLADDVKNYLNGDALNAGPPGAVYRLRKLARRHMRIAVSLIIVLVSLITGIVVSTRFAFKAERSRAEAQAITDFLQNDVFGSVSYEKARNSDYAYILDVATERLNEGRFEDQSLIEVSIRHTLGQAYNNVLKPEQALQHLERAHQICLERLGPENNVTIGARVNMGWTYRHLGRIDDAQRLWTEQLETLENGKVPVEVLESSPVQEHNLTGVLNGLANTHQVQGHYRTAESLFRRIHAINKRVRGDRHGGLWPSLNLAATLTSMGQYEEAETLFQEALDLAGRQWGPEGNWTLSYTAKLGNLYFKQGRISEAEALLVSILETQRRLFVRDHPQTLRTMRFLAILRMDQGNIEEAETLLMDAIKGKYIQNEFGEAYQELETKNTLAVLRIKQGQYAEARQLLQEALTVYRHDLGDENPYTLKVIHDLGTLHREQGRYQDANDLLCAARAGRRENLGPDHPDTLESMHELGVLHLKQSQYESAESTLLEAYKKRVARLRPGHPHTGETVDILIQLYEAWDRPEEAKEWRFKLQQQQATE